MRRPTFGDLKDRETREARVDADRLLHLVNDPESLRTLYDLSEDIATAPNPLAVLRTTIDVWREQVETESP